MAQGGEALLWPTQPGLQGCSTACNPAAAITPQAPLDPQPLLRAANGRAALSLPVGQDYFPLA